MTIQDGAYLIKKGYEKANLLTVGATPSVAQVQRGLEALNDMINLWSTQGLKLWLNEDIPIPLVAGQATYSCGPSGDVNMTKPLTAFQGYYQSSTGAKQPLVPLSRDEWTRLSQNNVAGALNSFFPDKQLNFLYINFYNTPDTQAATGTAHIIMRVAQSNFVLSTDTIGLPTEWYLALQWGLADELAVAQPQDIQDRCAKRAAAYRTALEDFDVEDGPVYFQPDSRTQYPQGRFR